MSVLRTLKIMMGLPSKEAPVMEIKEEQVYIPGLDPTTHQVNLMMVKRGPQSFYHSMLDEDFVTWVRNWSSSPVVLLPEDREMLLERLNPANQNYMAED